MVIYDGEIYNPVKWQNIVWPHKDIQAFWWVKISQAAGFNTMTTALSKASDTWRSSTWLAVLSLSMNF